MDTKSNNQIRKQMNGLVLPKMPSSLSAFKWISLVLVFFAVSGCSHQDLGGNPTQTGDSNAAVVPTPTINNAATVTPATSSTKKVSDDFDGDGKTDPAKFDLTTSTVWWLKSSTGTWEGLWLGNESYTYVSGSDFDGDGKTDPAKFIPSTGTVWWLKSSTGTWDGKWLGSDTFTYVPGSDFDGDGKTDPAEFVADTGTVWWIRSSDGKTDGRLLGPEPFTNQAKIIEHYTALWRLNRILEDPFTDCSDSSECFHRHGAVNGEILQNYVDGQVDREWQHSEIYSYVTGSDFDGDGKTDPAKFVADTGTVWWIRSSDGKTDGKWLGSDTFTYVPGSDFDGDGKTDPAKFVAGTGTVWWFKSSTGNMENVRLGGGSYLYVPGCDFNGDGKTDPAKYDTATHTLSWLNVGTGTWINIDLGTGTYRLVNGQ